MGPAARINYLWRLFATGLSFGVFGLGGVLIPLFCTPWLYLTIRDRHRRQRVARRLVHRVFRLFIHMMAGLGVLHWQTRGLEKLNRDGLLILANHPTLIDVVFLVAFVPNANCIVKGRLLNNPAMRGFIALTGYISNERGGGLLAGAAKTLNEGGNLLIFPEGTRTRPGRPLRFQRGAANVAVRCRADITPVVIHCNPPTLSKEHKWYHIPPRAFVMTFEVKDDIAIAPFLGDAAPVAARRLTHFLENFYTEENRIHEHRDSGERTQDIDHPVPGSGRYFG